MADAPNDFSALARQYLDLWGDALRGVAPQPAPGMGMHGMRETLDAWMRQAGAQAGFAAPLEHFNRQSSDWYAQMQQVAARFAGRDHSAADVASAWREAFAGGHPFSGLLDGMRGPGLESVSQWMDAATPSLHGLRAETAAALRMPAFGFSREHQERLQALGLAQLRWQEAQRAYAALMAEISRDAMARFESKLAEREEPGRQIGSVRALFDVWVDAAEEAWAKAALSPEYRHAFGELVNAQMRQRAAAQVIGEQAAGLYGWPARSELDSAHRKIAELERALRRLQRGEGAQAPSAVDPSAAAAKAPAAKKPAARKSAASKSVASKSVASKSVAKPAAARKPAAVTKKSAAIKKPVKKAAGKSGTAARKR
jgi:hypothetical protein